MRKGTEFIEYFTRHGLDLNVLKDFKSYGMLYCSQKQPDGSAIPYRFVDTSGFDKEWIEKIDSFETLLDISIYHIIVGDYDEKFGTELLCMYLDNDLDYEYQLKNFKTGNAKVIKYYPDVRFWLIDDIKYEVSCGGIVRKGEYDEHITSSKISSESME